MSQIHSSAKSDQQLKRRTRQIGALRRVGEALLAGDGADNCAQTLEVAVEIVEADAGAILFYDAPADALKFRCAVGPCAESLNGAMASATDGVAGQVLRTALPELNRHAREDENALVDRFLGEEQSAQSDATLLTLPLKRASGGALGVMQLLWIGAGEMPDECDVEAVQALCAALSSALETERLTREARRAEIVSVIGDISHDIKNMLTPIQSGVWTLEPLLDQLFDGLSEIQLGLQGRAAQAQIAEIVEVVRGNYGWILQSADVSCEQVIARTREIADAVKGELAAPVFEVADLNEVAAQVARPLFFLAEKTNVQLHLDLDHDLPHAEFDSKQLYNAIYNLVNNAIPETPAGGSVTIRTRAPVAGAEHLTLEVEDTGGGIPENVRARLFTDQAISTKEGGTGLGTRIVAGVVKRHQGEITVHSESGRGTRFSIRLPLRQVPVFDAATAAALPVRTHNLPAPSTSFVGRGLERARARELLQSARLVSFLGIGGTGKTRLALQVAAEVFPQFDDGVWLVSLATVDEAPRVAAAIAATLGVRDAAGRSLEEILCDFLRAKQMLLVLDNFEQVLDAAPFVARLLEECAGLKILVTSRAPLGVRGERELPVEPLGLPALENLAATPLPAQLHALADCEAVALFCQRASQVRPDFELNAENARDIARLCTRLDGLPLAIELAAARVKMRAPYAILAHLETHFALPGKGAQDAPRRHQSLQAALDWSVDLLAPAEQILLRRAMIFEGGFGAEAARAVAETDELELDVWASLELLCEKSLLRAAPQSDGSTWFFALQTVRDYGHEKLAEAGELENIGACHAAYYLAVAEAAHALLAEETDAPPPLGLPEMGASKAQWNWWSAREYENLRAGLDWFLERDDGGQHEALRMAVALRQVWVGGLWTERREALQRALAKSPDAPDEMRLTAMLFAGDLAVLQSELPRAQEFGQQSLVLSQKLGSGWAQARALGILANVALENADFARARALHEQSLSLHRELGSCGSIPWVLFFLGEVAKREGDLENARDYYTQSLSDFRKISDKEGIATALYQLSRAIYDRENPAPARAMLEESLAIFSELAHQSGIAWTRGFLGQMAADVGDTRVARAQMAQSLEIWRALGSRSEIYNALRALGKVALQIGDWGEVRARLSELLSDFAAPEHQAMAREVLDEFALLALERGEAEHAACLLGAAWGAQPDDCALARRIRGSLEEEVWQDFLQRGAQATATREERE